MPDEQKGKQRWREVAPLSEDERWLLDNPPPLPPASSSPPPLPRQSSRRAPLEPPPLDFGDTTRNRPHSADQSERGDSFRPPDEMLTEAVRRQRVAAQPKPIGSNTILAALLAIGAIALMVLLTMYLAKQN